jgi:hypothetical protein
MDNLEKPAALGTRHRTKTKTHNTRNYKRGVVAINPVLSNNIDEHRPYRGVMVRVLAMSGFEPLLGCQLYN